MGRCRKAGELRLIGESIRGERASESFGFDDVRSGVSNSDKVDDVDYSERDCHDTTDRGLTRLESSLD